MSVKLEWKKRRRHEETDIAFWTIRETTDGAYRVVKTVSKLERRGAKMAIDYTAMHGRLTIISRHKKQGPAQKACAEHAGRELKRRKRAHGLALVTRAPSV
jgi:hypothetical protein